LAESQKEITIKIEWSNRSLKMVHLLCYVAKALSFMLMVPLSTALCSLCDLLSFAGV